MEKAGASLQAASHTSDSSCDDSSSVTSPESISAPVISPDLVSGLVSSPVTPSDPVSTSVTATTANMSEALRNVRNEGRKSSSITEIDVCYCSV